jgi:hypothetical protein
MKIVSNWIKAKVARAKTLHPRKVTNFGDQEFGEVHGE